VISKDILKTSIGKFTTLSCTVSEISVDPVIRWSTNDKNGKIVKTEDQSFVNKEKTSILSVNLVSAKDTEFICTIESNGVKLTGTQESAIVHVYGSDLYLLNNFYEIC
jgi:hypothetical protein